MRRNIMQNFIFKGLNGQFKIEAATQYITRIKDSTKNINHKQIQHSIDEKKPQWATIFIELIMIAEKIASEMPVLHSLGK